MVWPLLLAASAVVATDAHGAMLSGFLTRVAAGSTADLTAEGALDWIHWGTYSEYGYSRKVNGCPLIGPLAAIITSGGGPFRYEDNLSGFNWADGTPDPQVTNTTAGVWVYSKNNGFLLTIAADPQPKRLQLHVGAFEARAQIEAWLSDASAPGYTNSEIDIYSNAPGGIYTLDFAANAPGQTLTISYVVRQEHDNKVGNVTLQAAAVSLLGTNNPPWVSLVKPQFNSTFASGNVVQAEALAGDADGQVTNVQFFQGSTCLAQACAVPWSAILTNPVAGTYTLRAVATDSGGLSTTSGPVQIFPHGSGGNLAGSRDLVPPFVDLSGLGQQDWAHWGYDPFSLLDRLAGGPGLIPDIVPLGTYPVTQVGDFPAAFSWTNGSPRAWVTTTTAIAVAGLDNGFELAVPATTYPQTLVLYVGAYASRGNLQSWLGDFSAPAYTDTSVQSYYNTDAGQYTLVFHAASPKQLLRVRYVSGAQYDMTYGGSVTWAAATVAGTAPPWPPVLPLRLASSRSPAGFTLGLATDLGQYYALEWTDSAASGIWHVLTNFVGSGGVIELTDPAPGPGFRFYRVVAMPPAGP